MYWNGVIPSSFAQPAFGLWRMIFWGGLFGIFYLLSIRQIYRLKAKFEGEGSAPPPPSGEKKV